MPCCPKDEFSVGYESLREVGKRLDQYFYKIQDKTDVIYTVIASGNTVYGYESGNSFYNEPVDEKGVNV